MSRHTCINILISIYVVQGGPIPNLTSFPIAKCALVLLGAPKGNKEPARLLGHLPALPSLPISRHRHTTTRRTTHDRKAWRFLTPGVGFTKVIPSLLSLCLLPRPSLSLPALPAACRLPAPRSLLVGTVASFWFFVARTSLQQSEVVGRRTCQETKRGGGQELRQPGDVWMLAQERGESPCAPLASLSRHPISQDPNCVVRVTAMAPGVGTFGAPALLFICSTLTRLVSPPRETRGHLRSSFPLP